MRQTFCRGCYGNRLQPVFSLGSQRLSDFPLAYKEPPSAPLSLVRCDVCTLVQLDYTMTRAELYHDRYGYASGVNQNIRDNLQLNVQTALLYVPQPKSWLDVASNDGTLLSFVPRDAIRVGVDPVSKFAPTARGHANQIIADYYHPRHFANHKFDVITAISVFYDFNDPRWFIETVTPLLSPHGVLVIQQNYLGDMIANTSFDNICHEHLTYFSLHSMQQVLAHAKTDLEIIRVDRDPVNGGCIRTVLAHRGAFEVDPQVLGLWQDEYHSHLNSEIPWAGFADRVLGLVSAVTIFAAEYAPVMIYGASTRGAVIWQAAGLGPGLVSHAVEAQESKVGAYYAALGEIPIISEQEARKLAPKAMLVGPYWHKDLFISRERDYMIKGGRLAFPLPEMDIWDKTRLWNEGR